METERYTILSTQERGANRSHRFARGINLNLVSHTSKLCTFVILLARISIPIRNSLTGQRVLHRELITNLHVRRELECGHTDHVRVGYIHKYRATSREGRRGCIEFADGDDGTSSYVRRKVYLRDTFARESLGGKPRSNEKSSLKSRQGKTASSGLPNSLASRKAEVSERDPTRGGRKIDSSPILRMWRIYIENKSET